jgi:DNA-binding NtrC family response regulator
MREVLELAERAAKSELAILILGETGTGKDLVASAILAKSRRAGNPFLKLNCATLNEALLESELFGHEAGAFTGATSPKVGLLETADDGTVFLDEVAELPLTIQAKLLRVVETHEFMRVGGRRLRSSNIRLISATNRDLLQAIKMGQFREDLYYRLAGFALFIPPLRERPDDILALAEAFLARVADGMRRPLSFSEEAMTALRNYPWPGNARELKHVIQRSCCLCDGPTILLRHLMFDQPGLATAAPSESTGFDTLPRGRRFPFLDSMAARELIAGALQSTAGNQTQAAKMLGISRRTLVNRLQTYGLPRPRQNSEHI